MKSKALLLIVVVSQLTCHQVLFTAPPGTDMECFPNPRFIPAFNGVSVISCILTEAAGTPVADGTVVQFFTDLGRIPEQGRTNDGVVRVNLQSDGRSGQANVSAISGGGEVPAPSPTATPSPGPVRGNLSASSSAGVVTASALMASGTAEVMIGNVNAERVLVVAFPNRLTDSRTSQITANVFDGDGNPVAGVPVFFTLKSAAVIGPTPTPTPTGTPTPVPSATPTSPPVGDEPVTEHMDSQGRPVFTDTNGQARDVMRTRYPREAVQRTVVVEATTANGKSGEVTVFIN